MKQSCSFRHYDLKKLAVDTFSLNLVKLGNTSYQLDTTSCLISPKDWSNSKEPPPFPKSGHKFRC